MAGGAVTHEFGYYDRYGQWVGPSPLPRSGQVAPVPFGADPLAPMQPGPQGIFQTRKHIPLVLAKVNTSGTQRTSASVAALIENPSARLIHSFSIGFEPAAPTVVGSFANAVWSATAVRRRRDGQLARLHSIFSNRSLPELWETTTAVSTILIEATLTVPLTAAAAAIAGDWVLVAEWEQGMPMCWDELRALQDVCAAGQTLFAAGPLAP